jgi:N-acetylneuraminic acid mutarotase
MAACFTGLLNDLYRFSPLSSEWEEVAQGERLEPRAQHRISALGGRIYLFGGAGESGTRLSLILARGHAFRICSAHAWTASQYCRHRLFNPARPAAH